VRWKWHVNLLIIFEVIIPIASRISQSKKDNNQGEALLKSFRVAEVAHIDQTTRGEVEIWMANHHVYTSNKKWLSNLAAK
jgi:hypothetical protein